MLLMVMMAGGEGGGAVGATAAHGETHSPAHALPPAACVADALSVCVMWCQDLERRERVVGSSTVLKLQDLVALVSTTTNPGRQAGRRDSGRG